MDLLTPLLKVIPPEAKAQVLAQLAQPSVSSYEERQAEQCHTYNQQRGTLEGYDCPDCLNRGGSYQVKEGEIVFAQCHCVEIRKSLRRIASSGLSSMLQDYTFENYHTDDPWQKVAKSKALAYVEQPEGWFYIGGQVGCGKTHLCTALVGELLRRGYACRYMLWRDEVVTLKASVNEDGRYSAFMEPLKTAPVLYIDDFFKVPSGGKRPTDGDLNIAFELLNYRYNNPRSLTILSSEHALEKILTFDEAVGSRIYQRAQQYCLQIAPRKDKNYRMKQES